jgi:hypothetical protein
VESRLAESRSFLDQIIGKVDSILVAFEPERVALVEEMPAQMEVARGRLKACQTRAHRTVHVVYFS